MKLPIVGPSYQMDALSFDVQRSVNQYPIMSEVGSSKEVSALRGTPGLELWQALGNGPIRGSIDFSRTSVFNGGGAVIISGNKCYGILDNFTVTAIVSTLNTSEGNVLCSQNNAGQTIIVDGIYGYLNTGAGYNAIADPDFPATPVSVTHLDGYFIVVNGGTQNYYISGINDGSAWDALDFGTASANPDNLVACIASNGNLCLLGETSTEFHQNTGNADFPFERIPGAIIPTGCAAAATVELFDNSFAWLGRDEQGRGVVWKADGYNAKRISTQAIEKLIATIDDLSMANAWVYNEEGHVFYALQIPGLDTTLVYDGSTGQWHERAYTDSVTGDYVRHLGSTQFSIGSTQMVGSRLDGKLYKMSQSYYDDAGQEILRERICPHIQDEKRLIGHSVLELDVETGIGNVTGEGTDPQIMMQYSDDGGRTWSNELWRSIGAIGAYRSRAVWRKLGQARDRVYKIRYSEKTKYQLNGAYLNAS